MSRVSIIVAIAEDGAIGKEQQLLCYLPNDLKFFKQTTNGHTIIMGRKTFESLPKGALPNRKNVVITRNKDLFFPNCIMCSSLEEAINSCKDDEEVFIIGGGIIYKQAITLANRMIITHIHNTFQGTDTFFPPISESVWKIVNMEKHHADDKHAYPYTFTTYERKND